MRFPDHVVGGLLLGVPMHVAALILTFAGGKYAYLGIAPHLCGAIGIAERPLSESRGRYRSPPACRDDPESPPDRRRQPP